MAIQTPSYGSTVEGGNVEALSDPVVHGDNGGGEAVDGGHRHGLDVESDERLLAVHRGHDEEHAAADGVEGAHADSGILEGSRQVLALHSSLAWSRKPKQE